MVDQTSVLSQLSKVGYKSKIWQRSEVKELSNVLHEDENIIQATNGYYEGGFGLLVATDHRLILVDKKPMFLTLDSIAFQMIQEISFNYRLLNSTIHIFTTNKCLDFSTWNHTQIRSIVTYVQRAMRDVRIYEQQHMGAAPSTEELSSYMKYEELEAPSSGTDAPALPTMPTPFAPSHVNENTQSAYTSSYSHTSQSTAEPGYLSTDSRLNAYQAPILNQRHYDRRYY